MQRGTYIVAGFLVFVALVGCLIALNVLAHARPSANLAQQTPVASNQHIMGLVGLTPHINLNNPNLATFTAADVRLLMARKVSPAGQLVKGAHITIEKILFVSAKEASTLMNGENVGLLPNAPVCYVFIRGPFVATGMHVPPGTFRTAPIVEKTEMVFDGRTGNLIVWGTAG